MLYAIAIFCALLIVGGVLVVVRGYRIICQARASASWQPTTGLILRSQLVAMSDSEGTSYAADVQYSYGVQGAEYTGNRIYFGDDMWSMPFIRSARKYTERYPVGRRITVYYDPRNPCAAILEPGLSLRSYATLVFGLLLMLAGAFFLVLAWVVKM
jgi:hypothetical protein